tara:strand:+ start:1660 stop:1941 length:282 start_codon:yes stop_codon:yes gene_type:complete
MEFQRTPAHERAVEVIAHLKRYIEALKQRHAQEIAGMNRYGARQAHELVELRMEAAQAAREANEAADALAEESAQKVVRKLSVEDILPPGMTP